MIAMAERAVNAAARIQECLDIAALRQDVRRVRSGSRHTPGLILRDAA